MVHGQCHMIKSCSNELANNYFQDRELASPALSNLRHAFMAGATGVVSTLRYRVPMPPASMTARLYIVDVRLVPLEVSWAAEPFNGALEPLP